MTGNNMYLFVATRNKTNVCMIVFSFYSISRSLREKIQPPPLHVPLLCHTRFVRNVLLQQQATSYRVIKCCISHSLLVCNIWTTRASVSPGYPNTRKQCMKTQAKRECFHTLFSSVWISRWDTSSSCLYGFSNESRRNRMFSFADLNIILNQA
jgi:hypothetical protein